MGLKGNRAVQDRRALERRVATLETRRRHLVAMRPALAAQAWDAARDFDRGRSVPVGQTLVAAACGPDPGVVDVVDCLCPGCTTKVPVTWKSGLCGPCANEGCEHPGVEFE